IAGASTFNGGAKGVEMNAILLAPTPVTKGNLSVAINAGHISKAQACEGAMAGVDGCN
ncbi:MAG TPA: D-xylose ABC transporter substrate-binding protein, partial [Rhodobacter sp.]|nr:D-xylose ABC transporter substrate-binding protein [Rhodobacter sp.]